uniref:Uncharacterized protein n=1 Tax=Amphimedon queenslandica TaxID=400682 RepID=A0A1X7VWQ5_AMPQE
MKKNKQPKSISVDTFGRYGKCTVQFPPSVSVETEDVLKALQKEIKLKDLSMKVFALYTGELGRPKMRLEKGDKVPLQEPLCLQRTGLDISKDLKIARTDDTATHLLYSEILNDPEKLHPTDEEKLQLEEFLDPSFPTERQYLEAAAKVYGYTSTRIPNCTLKTDIKHRGQQIEPGSNVTCTCNEDSFEIQCKGKSLKWEWKLIKRWKIRLENDQACFELCNEVSPNASILQWIVIDTDQAALLQQAAMEMCNKLLYKIKPELKPVEICVGSQGQTGKGFAEYMNLVLFGAGRNFTSLEDL